MALLQNSGRNFAFVFLELFFSKIINLPNLKAFHVLFHCSHWNYSQNVSAFPSDFIITISPAIPWLTSLLFLSLIINCPLVLRCVPFLPDPFVPLPKDEGCRTHCDASESGRLVTGSLPSLCQFSFSSEHVNPACPRPPLLLVTVFIPSGACSWLQVSLGRKRFAFPNPPSVPVSHHPSLSPHFL